MKAQMECDLMIAGIFDKLFKRKKPEEAEELSSYEYAEGSEQFGIAGDFEKPEFLDIPSELEMDSAVHYNSKRPEYRLKIHNKSVDMVGNINVYLRSDKKSVINILESKKVIEMLEPGKSANLKFKLKPKYELGKSGLYGKIEYFDFKSKERKILRLPQAYVDFDLGELLSKRINEDNWRQRCSGLKEYEIETKIIETHPKEVFNIFKNVLTNNGLFMLPPIENVNLYRGIIRFYGWDKDENEYAIEAQIIGDKQKSKVLFRVWSNDLQGAMALTFKTIDVIDGLIKIKQFIVET